MVFNCEEDILVIVDSLMFGLLVLVYYIEDFEEVYFVKLFKFFLGVNGLKL